MREPIITWHTAAEPDRATLGLIVSALRSNKRTKGAKFQIAAPTDCDIEGSVSIARNDPAKMIDACEVVLIINECLS